MRRALLVCVLAALHRANAQCPDGSSPPCMPARQIPALSVAVLGFRALGGERADTLLAEGLAEELTSRLGQLRRITVASRAAVRRLRDAESMPLSTVGGQLRVAFLLHGTLQRSGQRLRLRAELLRASSGAVLWSEQYDRSDADILSIQEAVGTRVAEGVVGRLLPEERASLAERPTKNAGAFADYLRARALWAGGASKPRAFEMLRTFQFAAQQDTAFAAAWAWVAILHSWMYWTLYDRSDARLDSAVAAASRARALQPEAGPTHLAFGYYYYWGRNDYSRALQELTAALASDPREPQTHIAIASVARRQGYFELALASMSRAIDIDPESADAFSERAATLRTLRRLDEADDDLKRARALNPELSSTFLYRANIALMRDGEVRERALLDSLAAHAAVAMRNTFGTSLGHSIWRIPGPHLAAAAASAVPSETDDVGRMAHYLAAAMALATLGDSGRARAAMDTVRSLALSLLALRPDESVLLATLAQAHAAMGNCTEAVPVAERAAAGLPVERDAFGGHLRQEILAEIEARCGLPDRAVERLERLLRIPSNITPARLRVDPAFASLRSNARFARLAVSP